MRDKRRKFKIFKEIRGIRLMPLLVLCTVALIALLLKRVFDKTMGFEGEGPTVEELSHAQSSGAGDGGADGDFNSCKVCNKPFEKKSMQRCDMCLYWYHNDCVGIDPSSRPEAYGCPECFATAGTDLDGILKEPLAPVESGLRLNFRQELRYLAEGMRGRVEKGLSDIVKKIKGRRAAKVKRSRLNEGVRKEMDKRKNILPR